MAIKAPVHYVDNKLLFQVLTDFLESVKEHKKNPVGDPPQTPEYIGECLLQIARRLSNKANFASYTFKDDMISDAVENCLMYMHNFDPAKSKNPFAYFTQIIHFAFLRRIERERRHVYTKYKYAMRQFQIGADHTTSEDDSGGSMKAPAWTSYENVHDFIRDYEEKLARPKRKKETPILDFEDDDIDDAVLEEESDILEHDSLVDKIPLEEETDEDEEEEESFA